MIQLHDVQFVYPRGEFQLQISQLEIPGGTTTAVIGPSGSGKTTLLNLVAGILVADHGKVMVGDDDLTQMSDSGRRTFRMRNIGLVFQEFELLEHLTVRDNILLPLRLTSIVQVNDHFHRRAEELASETGIHGKLGQYVRRLSQGERQRVALCRALVMEPPLLLCDEPTGNLDPDNKTHVLDTLFAYVERHATTMLTVTHDHQLLSRFDETLDFESFRTRGKVNA